MNKKKIIMFGGILIVCLIIGFVVYNMKNSSALSKNDIDIIDDSEDIEIYDNNYFEQEVNYNGFNDTGITQRQLGFINEYVIRNALLLTNMGSIQDNINNEVNLMNNEAFKISFAFVYGNFIESSFYDFNESYACLSYDNYIKLYKALYNMDFYGFPYVFGVAENYGNVCGSLYSLENENVISLYQYNITNKDINVLIRENDNDIGKLHFDLTRTGKLYTINSMYLENK